MSTEPSNVSQANSIVSINTNVTPAPSVSANTSNTLDSADVIKPPPVEKPPVEKTPVKKTNKRKEMSEGEGKNSAAKQRQTKKQKAATSGDRYRDLSSLPAELAGAAWYVISNDGQLMQRIMNVMEKLTFEFIQWRISKECVWFEQVHSLSIMTAKCCLMDHKGYFTHMVKTPRENGKDYIVCIKSEYLRKLCMGIKPSDQFIMFGRPDDDKLRIIVRPMELARPQKSFEIKQMDFDESQDDDPERKMEIPYDKYETDPACRVKTFAATWRENTTGWARTAGDTVSISFENNTMKVGGVSEFSTEQATFETSPDLSISCTTEVKNLIFSTKWLSDMAGAAYTCHSLNMTFMQDVPMLLDYRVVCKTTKLIESTHEDSEELSDEVTATSGAEIGYLKFMLAPQFENKDD